MAAPKCPDGPPRVMFCAMLMGMATKSDTLSALPPDSVRTLTRWVEKNLFGAKPPDAWGWKVRITDAEAPESCTLSGRGDFGDAASGQVRDLLGVAKVGAASRLQTLWLGAPDEKSRHARLPDHPGITRSIQLILRSGDEMAPTAPPPSSARVAVGLRTVEMRETPSMADAVEKMAEGMPVEQRGMLVGVALFIRFAEARLNADTERINSTHEFARSIVDRSLRTAEEMAGELRMIARTMSSPEMLGFAMEAGITSGEMIELRRSLPKLKETFGSKLGGIIERTLPLLIMGLGGKGPAKDGEKKEGAGIEPATMLWAALTGPLPVEMAAHAIRHNLPPEHAERVRAICAILAQPEVSHG